MDSDSGLQQARDQMCEIGRRLYARQLLAGSDGNLSYRLDASRVLCTPTRICKGFMKPADLCVVDLQGRQLEGSRRPTSELLLHLEIYRADPAIRGVVHCHPPHATAFAIAHQDIPAGILPEVDVFLGTVPRVPYQTSGTPALAAAVRPFVGHANTVLLTNHGSVSWSAHGLEEACWQTELLDACCRMLILARLLGGAQPIPQDKLAELARLRGGPEATDRPGS